MLTIHFVYTAARDAATSAKRIRIEIHRFWSMAHHLPRNVMTSWAISRADMIWCHLLQLERCPVQHDQFVRAPILVAAQRGKGGLGDIAAQYVPHDDVPAIGFIVDLDAFKGCLFRLGNQLGDDLYCRSSSLPCRTNIHDDLRA